MDHLNEKAGLSCGMDLAAKAVQHKQVAANVPNEAGRPGFTRCNQRQLFLMKV